MSIPLQSGARTRDVRRSGPRSLEHRPFECRDSELGATPHVAGLRAIARGIVGSDDLAADAVQETLVCLWRDDVPPPELRGWLVRTVVHKSLHIARAQRRRRRHEEAASSARLEPCPLCDPALELEHAELHAELEAALNTLSSELRSVFELRQARGLDYAAIARELAVPVGTVRSRLKRARERLAEHLLGSSAVA